MQRFVIKFELFGFTCTRTVRAQNIGAARYQAIVIEGMLKSKGIPIEKVIAEPSKDGDTPS